MMTLMVDIRAVHDRYFQFESKKRLAGPKLYLAVDHRNLTAGRDYKKHAKKKSPQIPGGFGAFMNVR